MDGVIFEGANFWLELHDIFGTRERGLALANEYMRSDYTYLASIVAGELWKGKKALPFKNLVSSRVYQPGVKILMDFLHRNQILTAIISTGPLELAIRAKKELGINEIRANDLEIKKGVFTGKVNLQVIEEQKARVGLDIMSKFSVTPRSTSFIGDSDSDVDLATIVSLPIAYNSHSNMLKSFVRYDLPHGKLSEVRKVLQETG